MKSSNRRGSSGVRRGWARPGTLAVGVVAAVCVAWVAQSALPPVPVPAQNPITESKRVLGKILFWDEQLSASGVMSCGSCHAPSAGGMDARVPSVHPGLDGLFASADDVRGSAGVIRSTADGDYLLDPTYGVRAQSTSRAANSMINAAYAIDLFWDGRARSRFVDPQTGAVVIPQGGGLESQAVQPPVSSIEMAHEGFGWEQIVSRLATAKPLELATDVPGDVSAVLASEPTYAELFGAAFGDEAITAARVAMAIATYERTLISDQTPFDRFRAGVPNAMTPRQVQGFNAFVASNCAACHSLQGDLLTDHTFRNIGLRPVAEDMGRQAVTGNQADRGRFKVPGLRNVGLKRTFMHNGMFTTIVQVIDFYARAPGAPAQNRDNLDPAMNAVNVPPQAVQPLNDFMMNALTDPRVANETFPFDRPTLLIDRPAVRAAVIGGGSAGTLGAVPLIVADAASVLGGEGFRTGVAGLPPGAAAELRVSFVAPQDGRLVSERLVEVAVADADGVATAHWSLDPRRYVDGDVLYAQWVVDDPLALEGVARSQVARIPVFCGRSGCPDGCRADTTGDGLLDVMDIIRFMMLVGGSDPDADLTRDGALDIFDVLGYFTLFGAGC